MPASLSVLDSAPASTQAPLDTVAGLDTGDSGGGVHLVNGRAGSGVAGVTTVATAGATGSAFGVTAASLTPSPPDRPPSQANTLASANPSTNDTKREGALIAGLCGRMSVFDDVAPTVTGAAGDSIPNSSKGSCRDTVYPRCQRPLQFLFTSRCLARTAMGSSCTHSRLARGFRAFVRLRPVVSARLVTARQGCALERQLHCEHRRGKGVPTDSSTPLGSRCCSLPRRRHHVLHHSQPPGSTLRGQQGRRAPRRAADRAEDGRAWLQPVQLFARPQERQPAIRPAARCAGVRHYRASTDQSQSGRLAPRQVRRAVGHCRRRQRPLLRGRTGSRQSPASADRSEQPQQAARLPDRRALGLEGARAVREPRASRSTSSSRSRR